MSNLVGTGLNQVPTNGMLGGLAYQDPNHASIKNLDLKNLSQINSEIVDTAVDVFVYDTRKDSDGGAWRKRTQHTSWYNETLNTSTRGSRKEFPAVAVLVLYDGGEALRIYDGDDPDLPMWMDFTNTSGRNYFYGPGATQSIAMLNGMFVTGSEGSNFWPILVDFLRDDCIGLRLSVGHMWHGANIAGRNTSVTDSTVYWAADERREKLWYIHDYLTNQFVLDVSMTVLPNAPIDSATGLPRPTILFGHSSYSGAVGGARIVNDTGSIHEYGAFNPTKDVKISGNNVFVSAVPGNGVDYIFKTNVIQADVSFDSAIVSGKTNYYMNSVGTTNPRLRFMGIDDFAVNPTDNTLYRAGSDGFDIIKEGPTVSNTVAILPIAYIASDYNTGYMIGDTKGAFLSGISTSADFGSELITGGDFSNASDWTLGTGWSINGSGQAEHTGNAGYITQTGSFTAGKYYQLTADLVSGGAATNFGMPGHHNTGGPQPHNNSSLVDVYCVDGGGKIYAMWKQSSVNLTNINLYANNSGTLTVDNVSIKEISSFHYNRSVIGHLTVDNTNKPLAVIGSITKTPVASGAELVAYSGFSLDNRLVQGYNSDLDSGTGDYYMAIWAYGGSDNQVLMIREHNVSDTDGAILILQSNSRYLFYSRQNGTPTWTSFQGSATYGNFWSQVVLVRSSGVLYGYVNGELVGSVAFTGDVSNNDASLHIGQRNRTQAAGQAFTGSLALARIGNTAPSPEQIRKMYEDEKFLFQENAKATLYGSSNVVTALEFDDTTNTLHVGTSAGRSDFQGLRRINNTTTAVTTAISASNDLVAEQ